MDDLVVEVANSTRVRSDIHSASARAHDVPRRIDEVDPLCARPDIDRREVQAGGRGQRSDQITAAVHIHRHARRVGGKEDSDVDQILRVFEPGWLAQTVPGARCSREERTVPERACKRTKGRDVTDARLAVLIRGNEGGKDSLPCGVVETVRVGLNCGNACDGLGPAVADVVGLAGVVPGNDLDEVGLDFEDLANALRQVQLATAVPVLAGVDVLELERRQRCSWVGLSILLEGRIR